MNISEYVTLGHPDKVADYISEYILDRLIEQDPNTRYALEVQIKDLHVSLAGEVTTRAVIDYKEATRAAVREIGYTMEYAAKWGASNAPFAEGLEVDCFISQQSGDIAQGVDADGWGDQGIMFGLAVNDPATDYMPRDYYLAKVIGQALYGLQLGGLDIKTQVVIDGSTVKKVIVAIPLLEDKTDAIKQIVSSFIDQEEEYELIINGTGKFIKHATMGDCGTTGRKLAVDFYGGNCNVGGGSPWTKDGTKADLTLNLYARKLALDYVKTHGVPYAKCAIGCCIGRAEIDITITDENNRELTSYTERKTPRELIEMFNLREPIFAELCRDGLFSRL